MTEPTYKIPHLPGFARGPIRSVEKEEYNLWYAQNFCKEAKKRGYLDLFKVAQEKVYQAKLRVKLARLYQAHAERLERAAKRERLRSKMTKVRLPKARRQNENW